MFQKHVKEDSSSKYINNNDLMKCSTTCSTTSATITKSEKFVTSVSVFGLKISLRVPKNLWNDFKALAKLEGLSASKVLERAVVEYVKNHSHGSQRLISNYMDLDEPSPMRVLCLYCQGALSNGEVFCQKASMWVKGIRCYSCKHNRLKKK